MAFTDESDSDDSEYFPDSENEIPVGEDEPLNRKKWDAAQVRS